MFTPIYTKQFNKDLKKIQGSGLHDIEKLKTIIKKILNNEKLDPKHKDHNLTGNYKARRECHITPDWLLIYKKEKTCIIFERTGNHSELF